MGGFLFEIANLEFSALSFVDPLLLTYMHKNLPPNSLTEVLVPKKNGNTLNSPFTVSEKLVFDLHICKLDQNS